MAPQQLLYGPLGIIVCQDTTTYYHFCLRLLSVLAVQMSFPKDPFIYESAYAG